MRRTAQPTPPPRPGMRSSYPTRLSDASVERHIFAPRVGGPRDARGYARARRPAASIRPVPFSRGAFRIRGNPRHARVATPETLTHAPMDSRCSTFFKNPCEKKGSKGEEHTQVTLVSGLLHLLPCNTLCQQEYVAADGRWCVVTGRSRRSRRKRVQARKNWENLKGVANASARGAEWVVMFLGMLVSFAGSFVAFLAGAPVYAILLLLFALFVGAALLKREAG
jgi:hypothetical protein